MSITFDEKLKFRKLILAIEDLDGCDIPLSLAEELQEIYSKMKWIVDNEKVIT